MKVTIHQPEHLPWLGFFNKLSKAEVFVVLDSVQYEKNYYQNRNRILGSNGVQWIGVPVTNAGHMHGTIANTTVAEKANPRWRSKYLRTVAQSYSKYPYFEDVYEIVEDAVSSDTVHLVDINMRIIMKFSERLGYSPLFVHSSNLSACGSKSDLILEICKEVDADTYIAGPSGRNYLEKSAFDSAGVEVVFNDYTHPAYPQRAANVFVSHLSAIDLFMNCGFSQSRIIIEKGNEGFGRDWTK